MPWLAVVGVPWLVSVNATGVGLLINLAVPIVAITAASPALTQLQRRRLKIEAPDAGWRYSGVQIAYRLVIGPLPAAGLVFTVGMRKAGVARLGSDARCADDLLRLDGQEELLRRPGAEAARQAALDGAPSGRRRLERDPHDGLQQHLVAVAVELALLRNTHPDAEPAMVAGLQAGIDHVTGILRDVHALVRGFRPPILDEHGLEAALSAVVASSPLHVTVRNESASRLPEQVETIVYFLVAEALTNAAKHAGARRAEIDIDWHNGVVRAWARDDGTRGATVTPGGGLPGLTHRVHSINGTRQLTSPTTLLAELPCA